MLGGIESRTSATFRYDVRRFESRVLRPLNRVGEAAALAEWVKLAIVQPETVKRWRCQPKCGAGIRAMVPRRRQGASEDGMVR
jgi:hypothetical protein